MHVAVLLLDAARLPAPESVSFEPVVVRGVPLDRYRGGREGDLHPILPEEAALVDVAQRLLVLAHSTLVLPRLQRNYPSAPHPPPPVPIGPPCPGSGCIQHTPCPI